MQTEQYMQAGLLLLVSAAAINDLATRRIPNRLLLAGLGGALLLHLVSATPGAGLLAALGGMALGLALFLPFYLLRGMAAGDVKLMGVVGAFTGAQQAFAIALLAWCVGGMMALLVVLLRRRLGLALANLAHMLRAAVLPGVAIAPPQGRESAGSIPYGVAIAIGTIVVLVRQYG